MTAVPNGQRGLQAEYFQGIEFASERWTGYYLPTSAGSYDIFVGSTGEDGGYFRLYVDNKLISIIGTLRPWCRGHPFPSRLRRIKIVLEYRGRSRRPQGIIATRNCSMTLS